MRILYSRLFILLLVIAMLVAVGAAAGATDDGRTPGASPGQAQPDSLGIVDVDAGDDDRDVPMEIPLDQVILDDLIVEGSACIGFDCVNGESFGFDTIRLKENNLRISFVDTSTTASFPGNDWQITANDSSNGGANKFSIDDITGGSTPFTVEAGAPSHSLFVDDRGYLGLGTSTPVLEIHVAEGDTPGLRLDQDGTSGWAPQVWDVAGNETNFFIRDATNGSQLPFRIFPGADSSALVIGSDSHVGLGTSQPDYPLEISASSERPRLGFTRLGGEEWIIGMDDAQGAADVFAINRRGTGGDEFIVFKGGRVNIGPGNSTVFDLSPTGDLEIEGTLTENSDVNTKTNIEAVDPAEVLLAVKQLPLSTWSYIVDLSSAVHMGPMAQDFYAAFGLGADETGISSLDTSGVALAAIQALVDENDQLRHQMSDLADRLSLLEIALEALTNES